MRETPRGIAETRRWDAKNQIARHCVGIAERTRGGNTKSDVPFDFPDDGIMIRFVLVTIETVYVAISYVYVYLSLKNIIMKIKTHISEMKLQVTKY